MVGVTRLGLGRFTHSLQYVHMYRHMEVYLSVSSNSDFSSYLGLYARLYLVS